MTDKQPTPRQIEEFWGWCGFRNNGVTGTHGSNDGVPYYKPFWYDADGELYSTDSTLPPLDLNDLFKYAVPKAIDCIIDELKFDRPEGEHYLLHKWSEYRRKGMTWEDSLFWAIQEVIKK